MTGNARKSWEEMKVNSDDRVDYNEMMDLYRRFPKLFQPAFQLQDQMMICVMGRPWWDAKVIHYSLCFVFARVETRVKVPHRIENHLNTSQWMK